MYLLFFSNFGKKCQFQAVFAIAARSIRQLLPECDLRPQKAAAIAPELIPPAVSFNLSGNFHVCDQITVWNAAADQIAVWVPPLIRSLSEMPPPSCELK